MAYLSFMLLKTLLLAALGVVEITAQLTNSTLLSILNTTQLSPSYKFIQLLQSSPELKPVLDVLSKPGNVTLFVPSDAVFDRLIQQYNQTQQQQNGGSSSGGNGTSSSGGTGALTEGTTATDAIETDTSLSMAAADASGNNSTASQGSGNQGQSVFPQGFRIYQNFTLLDVINYHIVNETVLLQNETNQTVILNSLLTNQTADKFGYGMPLILNSNTTQQNSSSSSSTSGGGGSSGSSSAATSTGTSSTSASVSVTSPAAGWISRIKQLVDNQASSSSSGSNSSQTPVYWIGNGLATANVTLHDIQASNGVLHVIDDVLIPPGNATNVFSNISDASALSEMIQENPQVSQALSNATNVTIFAPNDKGLCMVCIDQLGQDKWRGLVMNHVVPGVYYTTNLTNASSGGSSSFSLTTEAGERIPISSNSSGITCR
ncbi:uncharacterized protein BX664DRAFT_146770 [Halteromyces radiatus]|uniref:uncharacterized protein n=1 Tax=Halteromyces radiatus TaxID=101107 RepID=UPI00221F92A2|nr:uncharacterized protein BX664DRAFT_146770 [Halteromyces radiatus]KAI8090002.1 hypothetical protein BX664DRAFT_146770 [Halteromyces radiatus]